MNPGGERRTLLIATTNPGKIKEIQGILDEMPLTLLSLADFPAIVEPEETGSTFAENARLKALHYHQATGLAAVHAETGLSFAELAAERVATATSAESSGGERTP